MQLRGKNVVVIGASRGVGRAIAKQTRAEGARVLAVARDADALVEVRQSLPGVATLALDAADELAARTVFDAMTPDVLVISGGAAPPTRPLPQQDWEEFSRNWNVDVRISFNFCRAALAEPLSPGALVALISSGAAMSGSPITGGYAGAKRMQMFMAGYCQRESERLGLGVRFLALAPLRIMPQTEMGRAAVDGYAKYFGITSADFVAKMDARQSPDDVAHALIALAAGAPPQGYAFAISGKGLESLA